MMRGDAVIDGGSDKYVHGFGNPPGYSLGCNEISSDQSIRAVLFDRTGGDKNNILFFQIFFYFGI
jgi:hypothetical protein